MTDQHITAIATIVQDLLLFLSALLVGWYLVETRKLRIASQEQVEAASRPAIVVKAQPGTTAVPTVVNIGNGPAIDVQWSLTNSKWAGSIPYLEPDQAQALPMSEMKAIYHSAVKTTSNTASIECSYRSLSGRSYSSSNAYDFDHERFITTFRK